MCFIFDWEKIVLVRPISESIKYLQRVRMKSVKLEILEMIFFSSDSDFIRYSWFSLLLR